MLHSLYFPSIFIHVLIFCPFSAATSMSPPTRDSIVMPVPKNEEERMLQEIQRLRREMHTCLNQIKSIQQLAKQGTVRS